MSMRRTLVKPCVARLSCFSRPGDQLLVSQNLKRHSSILSLLVLHHFFFFFFLTFSFLILAHSELRQQSHSVSQTCAVCLLSNTHHSVTLSGLASLRLGHRGDEEWHSGANQLLVVWLSNSSPVNCLKATSVRRVLRLTGGVGQSGSVWVEHSDAQAADFREVWPVRSGSHWPEVTRGQSEAVLEQHL